jgi:lysophospholipase L1-like esterase
MLKHLSFLLLVILSLSVHAQNRFENDIVQIERRVERMQLAAPVIFTGSSTIRMWPELEKRFADFEAVNAGFGGSQVSDLVYFQDRLLMKHNNLRAVVFYSGDNDLGSGRTVDQVVAGYQKMIASLAVKFPKTPVIILSVKQSPSRAALKAQIIALNQKLSELDVHFVDFNAKIVDADGNAQAEYFLSDRLHMNKKAYEIIEEMLLEKLKEVL